MLFVYVVCDVDMLVWCTRHRLCVGKMNMESDKAVY